MMKLNILNMKKFLQTINSCNGSVYLIYPDGRRVDINRQYGIQGDLIQKFQDNQRFLKLTLDVPDKTDYINVVITYIGSC